VLFVLPQAERDSLQLNQACDLLTEAALKAAAQARQQQEQQGALERAAHPPQAAEQAEERDSQQVAATTAGHNLEPEPWAARYGDEASQELLARAQASQKVNSAMT
jgi:hypothetical protein